MPIDMTFNPLRGFHRIIPFYSGFRKGGTSNMEPVLLRTVTSELEADMVVGLIESNGLRAYSLNASSHGVSHYGGQSARSGPLALYRIYVHPEDEAEARQLVDSAALEPQVDLTAEKIDDVTAPESYPRPNRDRTKRLVAAVVLVLLAYPIGLAVVNLYRTLFVN